MPPRLFVGFWTVARRRCGVRVRATRPVRAADAVCDSPGLQREATHAGWQTVEAGLNTTPGHPRTCSVNRVRSRMDSVHRMPTQIGSSRLGHPPRAHSRFRRGVKCLCGRAAWWGAAVRNCPTDGRCDAAGAWRRMRTKVLCRHSHLANERYLHPAHLGSLSTGHKGTTWVAMALGCCPLWARGHRTSRVLSVAHDDMLTPPSHARASSSWRRWCQR